MPSPRGSCGTVCLVVALRSATVTLVRAPSEQTTRIEVAGPGERWDDEQDRAAIEKARLLMESGNFDEALGHLGKRGQAHLMVWDTPPTVRHVTIRHAPEIERSTQVRLDAETAATVRQMAATFDYVAARGTGAGAAGNPAAFLEALALRWRVAPDEMQRVLADLIARIAP